MYLSFLAKKLFFLFFLNALMLSSLQAQKDSLSLDKALQLAIAHNQSIKALKIQEKIADAQIEISKIDKMPSIYLSLSDYLNAGRSIDPTSNTFITQQINSFNATLGANITLYEGNKKNKQIAYDKKSRDLFQNNTNKNVLDLQTEVIPVFLQTYYYQEEIEEQKSILKEIELYHQKQKELWQNNLKPFTDTLISYSRLLENTNRLNTSLNNKISSLEDLSFYVQTFLTPDIVLTIEKPQTLHLSEFQGLDQIHHLLQNHPEIVGSEINTQLLHQKLQLIRTSYYPRLALFGNLNSIYSSFQNEYTSVNGVLVARKSSFPSQLQNNFRQSIGVELQMPISVFYQTPKQIKKVNFELEKQEADKQQIEHKLSYQIKKNVIKYLQAKQEFENYQSIEKATEQTYQAINEKMQKGFSTWFEWFQVLNDWQNKKLNLLRLKINYLQETEKIRLLKNTLEQK